MWNGIETELIELVLVEATPPPKEGGDDTREV